MRERLYAARITRRTITILQVPEAMREAVLAVLPEHDRLRCEAVLAEASAEKPTKAEIAGQVERAGE